MANKKNIKGKSKSDQKLVKQKKENYKKSSTIQLKKGAGVVLTPAQAGLLTTMSNLRCF